MIASPPVHSRQYLISVVPASLLIFDFFFLITTRHFRSLIQNPSDIVFLAIHSLSIRNHVIRPNILQLNSKPFAWRDKTRPLLQNFPLFHLKVWPSRHPLFAILQSIRHHGSITLVTQPIPFLKPPSQPLCFGRNPA